MECEDVQLNVELIGEIQKPNYILRNFKYVPNTVRQHVCLSSYCFNYSIFQIN